MTEQTIELDPATIGALIEIANAVDDQCTRTLVIVGNSKGSVWIEDVLVEPDNRVLWESDAPNAQAHAVEKLREIRQHRLIVAVAAAAISSHIERQERA